MSTTIEAAKGYIEQFISSLGLSPAECFNSQKNAWYLKKGSANIEVFISSHQQSNEKVRNYLRIYSPIMQVPATNVIQFYRRLLELNDTSLGVKISIMKNSNQVYCTFERDLNGIDYDETQTCISDLAVWADFLDDSLKKEFNTGWA